MLVIDVKLVCDQCHCAYPRPIRCDGLPSEEDLLRMRSRARGWARRPVKPGGPDKDLCPSCLSEVAGTPLA